MSLGQRTMLFRPNQKVVHPVFLWFQVRSPFVYQQALRKNTGSTVGHVNIADIRKFQVFVPSLDLQRKFGERLSKVRKLKEQIINTAEKSQKVFDAIMKQHY
jgi:restriction endonuclease S subunit